MAAAAHRPRLAGPQQIITAAAGRLAVMPAAHARKQQKLTYGSAYRQPIAATTTRSPTAPRTQTVKPTQPRPNGTMPKPPPATTPYTLC